LLGATLALSIAVPAAMAEEEVVVPPANSAVNQYTEAFPTAGGDKEAHNQKGRDVAAGKVIGAKNARKLDQHGADGRAAARFAADTAPNPVGAGATAAGQGGGNAEVVVTSGDGNGGNQGGGGAQSGAGGGNAQTGQSAPNPATGSAPQQSVHTAEADGSSGLSEVLSRATGSSGSGGGMGIFLPLLILAAIAWAIAYTVRQRRPVS
jgi:hypothetical protein